MVTKEQLEYEVARLKAVVANLRRELRDAKDEANVERGMKEKAQERYHDLQRSIRLD